MTQYIQNPTRQEVVEFMLPLTKEMLNKARQNNDDYLISFHTAKLRELTAEKRNIETNFYHIINN